MTQRLNLASCTAPAALLQSVLHLAVLEFSPREIKLLSFFIIHIDPLCWLWMTNGLPTPSSPSCYGRYLLVFFIFSPLGGDV